MLVYSVRTKERVMSKPEPGPFKYQGVVVKHGALRVWCTTLGERWLPRQAVELVWASEEVWAGSSFDGVRIKGRDGTQHRVIGASLDEVLAWLDGSDSTSG